MSKETNWRTLRRQYKATVAGSRVITDVSTSGNRGDEILILTPLGMSFADLRRALGLLSRIIESDFPKEKRRRKLREKRQIAELKRQAEK